MEEEKEIREKLLELELLKIKAKALPYMTVEELDRYLKQIKELNKE